MASLSLYTSNRLVSLSEELAQLLAGPGSSPLEQEIVVVPSLGLRRWLSLEIARLNGVCANVSFPFVADFIRSLPQEFETEPTAFPRTPPEEITWAIHRILPGLLAGKEFKSVRSYLADSDPLKLFQLSERLAALFDQYLVYRPEMIARWDDSKARGDEAWQAILWRELSKDDALTAARDQLQKESEAEAEIPVVRRSGDCRSLSLPDRIFVFGLTALPPVYLETLFQVAKTREVHLFLLQPSKEYHGDDLTPKQRARRNIDPSEPVTGNPLLTSLGRQSSYLTELLIDTDERLGPLMTAASEEFDAPTSKSLLSILQSDVLNATNRGRAAPEEVRGQRSEVSGEGAGSKAARGQRTDARKSNAVVDPDDRSLQIHSCHSPMREVEVLYDQLLDLFERDRTLRPRDILVMSPEIEKYSPFIRAVFGYPENVERRIPYSISDRHPRSESVVVDTFLKLLELPTSRCTAEEIFGFISSPVVAQRFGFLEDDLSLIHSWIRDTGICWGIDADHRGRVGVPGTDLNTWRFGLNRLLLGYAMRGENRTIFHGTLPYDEVEGDGGEILGRFATAVEAIFGFVARAQNACPLSEWVPILRDVVDRLLESEDEDQLRDLRFIRRTLSRLEETAAETGATQDVELTVLYHHLENLLGAMEQRGGFLTGGVTFCALKPARSIPARAIFLLGMNDDVFPRRPQPAQFDLMTKWQPGDPSAREDDRYAFLETICAAGECLQISYIGRSIVDNQTIPPSVVVSELLDYLGQAFIFPDNRKAREYLTIEHPLQGFSARYFPSGSTDQRLFTFSDANAAAATASSSPNDSNALPPFLVHDLPAVDVAQQAIQINQLISFLAGPARFFLKARFGIDLNEYDDALPDDEPIELNQLKKYHIKQELLTERIDEGKANLEVFTARGITPAGVIGQLQLRSLDHDAATFRSTVLPYIGDGKRGDALAIDLRLGQFSLSGRIESVYGGKIVHYRCANLNVRDRLRAWIEHLARLVSDGQDPSDTILVGKDEILSWKQVTAANPFLTDLCQLYWNGLHQPVAFFHKSGFADVNAEQSHAGNPPKCARTEWNGEYKVRPGEREDRAIERLFPDADPLSEESIELARRVFGPLLRSADRQAVA